LGYPHAKGAKSGLGFFTQSGKGIPDHALFIADTVPVPAELEIVW
jgi:hypothetical protein